LVAKGTGRAVFNLTAVNVGCQDEAVVTQVADVAYGSKAPLTERPVLADSVAKVENRTTPKISQKLILRRLHHGNTP
jgi:hypothetical protein